MKKNIIIFFIIYFTLFVAPLITLNKSKTTSSIVASQKIGIKKDKVNKDKISTSINNKEKSQIDELSNIISSINIDENKQNIIIDNVIKSDGYFDILNDQTGNIDRISEKDYVIGAVCAEMPPTFHTEALKAQAISAHTYALKMRQQQTKNPSPELHGADFSANPNNWEKYVTKEIAKKRFGDKFHEYWNAIESASNDVIDIIMLYDNEPIIAAYHAISSGKTESASNIWGGEAPYLIPTESYGDNLAPGYETKTSLSLNELKNILNNKFPQISLPPNPSKWFENINRSDSGSVLNINIDGYNISGNKIRHLLNLRSSNFTVNYDSDKNIFNFIVKGYGHDIGLSQYGANYMANNGSNFEEILNHYYSNISFAKVSKISQ